MTSDQYRDLYNALRQWQIEETVIGGKQYNAAETILSALFDKVYTQLREQER